MVNMPVKDSELVEAAYKQIAQVRTKTLDISFNELADMYDNQELIIKPDYQRLFRWSQGKQSRFIESLILEMPIPPIYVIEEQVGVYELIDGLQRISTYLCFRGKLRKPDSDELEDPLCLMDCDIVKELDGHTFETLPSGLQIRLKRSFIRVEVLRNESDQRMKYHMFKRLNTGGENLSDQEVRNCTIRLLDPTFNNFIIELSQNEDFRTCVNWDEDLASDKEDQELVLRFFAFKNNRQSYVHEVSDFLTDYMETVSDFDSAKRLPFDYEVERTIFTKTFRLLSNTMGETSFGSIGRSGQPQARLLNYHYEAFTIGIQKLIDIINPDDPNQTERLKKLIIQIKADPDFKRITTGGGKNYKAKLDERIAFVETRLVGSYEL